jgi:methylphosphotriester-DNA--protein-cysteine methyltransferase
MAQFKTSSSRWGAIQSRDPLAASSFVYCVTTTKIYCRPTCPSRLARRANVVFHETATAAEADGFRPCKRCRPALKENEGDPQIIAVQRACELIKMEMEGGDKWAVKPLAKKVGLTESHFCRIFKKIVGVTVGEYRSQIQGKAASEKLSTSSTVPIPDSFVDGISTAQLQPRASGVDGWESMIDFSSSEFTNGRYNFSGSVPVDPLEPCPWIDLVDFDFPFIHSSSSQVTSDYSTPEGSAGELQFLDCDLPTLQNT